LYGHRGASVRIAAVKRVRVVVEGRVQGVFFRSTCATLARRRGLTGFVRNLPDGRVEAAFEGIDDDVDALVAWCGVGPDHARVERVEVSAEEVRGERDFRVTD
jgi:acylphosphatase